MARRIPLWLKLAYTAMVCVIAPLYWQAYGPGNFLWFSDIALFALAVALWQENALLASMMAVGTLLFELGWLFGFIAGGRLLIAGYMFDPALPLWLRALSGFHLVLVPLMIFLLRRLGYDRRAVRWQTALAWLVIPASYFLTGPEQNVNWVYGPGMVQAVMPPLLWLAMMMVALPLLVYWPTHLVLKRFFPEPRER